MHRNSRRHLVGYGLDWSLDDRTFYFVDTLAQTVDTFDFDLDVGALAPTPALVEIDAKLGSPDGLTVDADGGVWVAVYGGGQVHRYTPAACSTPSSWSPMPPRPPAWASAARSWTLSSSPPPASTSTPSPRRSTEKRPAESWRLRPGTVGQAATSFG